MRMMLGFALIGLALAGCNGRWDTQGSAFNPSCGPDGAVVYYEYPNQNGEYEGLKNSPENCPWKRAGYRVPVH